MASRYNIFKRVTRRLVDEALDAVKAGFANDETALRPVELTQLEQRILMSASPMAAVAEAVEPTDAVAETSAGDHTSFSESTPVQHEESAPLDPHSQNVNAQNRIELVVVDPSAENHEQLIADLEAQEDRHFEILLLNPREDGIAQITDALTELRDVSALHLVSHGEDGEILLGTTVLSQRTIQQHAAVMVSWQYSLTADADLLIYGCDLAATAEGRELTESLNVLLGTDIAASDDDTGHASYQADWELEHQVGDIETSVAFSGELQQDWLGKLATITVDTTADVVDAGDGFTSLREAIIQANSGSGGDTILLGSGTYTLSLGSAGDDNANEGDLDINESVTIVGASASSTIIDGDGFDRVFHVRNNAVVVMKDLTITGGFGEKGTGIYVDGATSLGLTRVNVVGNDSDDNNGGGIFNKDAIVTLTDVSVTGNTAGTKDGGGIRNEGQMTLERVTIAGNSASDGGGIISRGGSSQLTIINTTISGNTASAKGGGIETNRDIDIINSTIANNVGEDGAGINDSGGTVTIVNSILSGNTRADLTPENVVGTLVSNGYNIDSDGTGAFSSTGDQSGVDPLLAALAYNGGFTQTHALQTGSTAIDNGTATGAPATDQRGYSRDANTDIGAYEVTTGTTRTTAAEDRGSQNAIAVAADGSYVKTWSGLGDDGDGWGVFAQRFDANGNATTGEILINQTTADDQKWARVASDDAGNFIVTWTSLNQDGTASSVYFRRFAADGTALSNETRANTANSGTQKDSVIAMSGTTGDFVIAWEGDGLVDSDVYHRRFNADGTAKDASDVRSTQNDSGAEVNPTVAMNDNGQFVIAYSRSGGIYIRHFQANGSGNHTETLVDNGLSPASRPAVAIDAAGNSVVVYREEGLLGIGAGVWAAKFADDGTNITGGSGYLAVSNGSGHTDPSISMDDAGNFAVVFEGSGSGDGDGNTVFIRRYDASPAALEARRIVNVNASGNQQDASVAIRNIDDILVAWSGDGPVEDNSPVVRNLRFDIDVTANDDSYTTAENTALNIPVSGVLLNDQQGPGATAGNTLGYTAASDSDGDNVWSNGTGTSGFDWDFSGGGVTYTTTPTTSLSNISAAWVFDGSGGGTAGAFNTIVGNPTDDPASFELWFNPTDAVGQELIFETGGNGQGTSLSLNGSTLELLVTKGSDTALATYDLASEIAADEFIQVMAVVDNASEVPDVYLYVNGHVVDSVIDVPGLTFWGNGDASGLGAVNGTTSSSNTSNFQGEIAAFRLYEEALPTGSIQTNYESTAAAAGTALTAITPDTSGTNGSVTLNADGSFTYTPQAGFTGVDTFSYTASNGANSDTATVSINVNGIGNGVPTADAGGPYTISEGASVTLDASGSSDPDSDPLTYEWDLDNDGDFDEAGEATGVSPTVSWTTLQTFGIDDDGTYTIGLQVTDGNGGTHSATTTITVNNIAPTLSASGTGSAVAGGAYTLNLSASDAGADTITSWTINWGDGTIETIAGNPGIATHTYSSTTAGFTFNILAAATDEDGTYLQNELLVASSGNDRLLRFDTDGTFLQQLGVGDGSDYPVDVIVGPDGNIYVSGWNSDNVLRFNASTGAFIDEFVTAGSGGLNSAAGLAFGADGNLYVASRQTNEVLRYNASTGAFIDAFVTAGSGGLNQAEGLAFGADGFLYVSDYQENTVLKYNGTTGAFVEVFVTAGSGSLDKPEDLTFGPDGNLYVADDDGGSVLRFDGTTGAFIDEFVAAGSGGLSNATGIAFGPDGNLYVGSWGTNNVLRYDGTTGGFIDAFVTAGSGGLTQTDYLNFLPEHQVTVSPPANNTPTAHAGGPYTINQGASVTLNASGSSDPDSDPLTYKWDLDNDGDFDEAGEPTGVSPTVSWATLSAFGITVGDNTIGVQVDDGNGGIHVATTTLTVSAGPSALDDFASTAAGTPTTVFVTVNDTDPNGMGLQVLDTGSPTNGAVVNNHDGTVTYTPNGGFSGGDSFNYIVTDGTDGLTHYWNLNGNANDSIGGAHGTVSGGVTSTPGAFGSGLTFNETDGYIEVPDFNYSNEFTVSFKFKVDENAGSDYQYLYSHGDAGSVNSLNIFLGEDSRPSFSGTMKTVFGDADDSYDLNALNFDASAIVGDGDWHTYTLTVDSTNGAQVFLDGTLRASDASRGGDAFNPTGNLFFGSRENLDADRFFGGSLDTVTVFSRALDTAEVSSLTAPAYASPATAQASVIVTVTNSAPTADAGGPYAINEGDSLTLDGTGSTDPENDSLTYEWDVNYDGVTFTADFTNAVENLTWAQLSALGINDDGSYQVALRVSDGTSVSSIATQTITVANSAPVLTVNGDSEVGAGSTFTLNLEAADDGQDSYNWVINWGDGEVSTATGNTVAVDHIYTNAGFTNNIVVTATDEDGKEYSPNALVVTGLDSDHVYFNGDGLNQLTTQAGAPVDVLTGPDGLTYVLFRDTAQVLRFNPATGDLVGSYILPGTGGLNQPSKMAFGPDGALYITNFGTNSVLKFGGDGRFLTEFVTGLDEPSGIVFDRDGNLFVSNSNTGEIFKFDGSTGLQIGAGPFATFGAATFSDLNIGANGNLFASSTVHNVIREFDAAGNTVGNVFGGTLTGITEAAGFAWGPGGRLYVADFGTANTVVYEADGSVADTLDTGMTGPTGLVFTAAHRVTVNTPPVAVADTYSVNEGQTLTVNAISDWAHPAWKTRHQITFNNAGNASNLSDFRVLVRLHESAVDAVTVDYSAMSDGGQDLRFVDADGTLLNHEVEHWDASGYSYIWVEVPQIDAGSTTDYIWMYSNHSGAADRSDQEAVWGTDYSLVAHANRSSTDSSANNNIGGVNSVTVAGGIVAGAGSFDGSDSYVNFGSDANVDDVFAGGGTISVWINPDGWGENGYGRILDKADGTFAGGSTANGWAFQVAGSGSNGYLIFEQGFSGTAGRWRTTAGSLTLGSWQHIVFTYDNSSPAAVPQIYIDGVAQTVVTSQTPTGTANSDAANNLVQGNYSQVTSRTFDGAMDELRFGRGVITADQVAAEYQNVAGGLVSGGAAESGPTGVLANDSDAEGNSVTVALVSGPAHSASFSLNADGSFSYEHDGSETTSDTFVYRLTDSFGVSSDVNVTLNITGQNDAPTISSVPDQTIVEDGSGSVSFTVADVDNAVGDLVVTATSSDQTLIPDGNLLAGGTGGSRSLSITPAPNQTGGPVTITVTVSDGTATSSMTFDVTITAEDDAPTISPISDVIVAEDVTSVSVPFTISDSDSVLSNIGAEATSNNQSLIADASISVTGTGANRTIDFVPVANATGTATITLRVFEGGVETFETFDVVVTPVNDAPAISQIADQTVAEDGSLGPLSFTVNDVDNAAGTLTVSATSSDQSLIANGSITLTGTGSNRQLSLTPEANQTGGPVTITVTVSDGTATSSMTFDVTITAEDDAPTIGPVSDVTVAEDATNVSVPFTISDSDSVLSNIGAEATSNNQSLITDGSISVTGTGANRTIDFVPVANATGTATITLRVFEGGVETFETFDVVVTPVNDAPTISQIADQAVAEDGSLGPLSFTVNDIDNAAGTLTVSATSSDQSLIANGSITLTGTGSNRQLSLTPVANQSGGPVTITVTVSDGSATSSMTFDVTITAEDDAPAISPISDVTIAEDATSVSVPFTISDSDSVLSNIGAEATSNNQSLIADGSISVTGTGANRTIDFVPVANATGTATITLRVFEGGVETFETFDVVVEPVNDAPAISQIADQTVVEDGSLGPLSFTVNDIDNAAGTLTVLATSSGQSLIANGSITLTGTGSNRQLSLTPVANQSGGPVTITVTVSDGTATSSMMFDVTITAVNDAPMLSGISDFTVLEDEAVTPFDVTVTDVDGNAGDVTLVAVSDDQSIVRDADIVVTGTGATRTISFATVANSSGDVTITLVASDGLASSEYQIDVTVDSVNDVPTISAIADLAIDEDHSSGPIQFTISDLETRVQDLTVTAETDSPHLIDEGSFVVSGNGPNRVLRFEPKANAWGTGTVTVRVSDGEDSAETSFVVDVAPVNDAPVVPQHVTYRYDLVGAEQLVVGAPTLLQGAYDVDGDALSIVLDSAPTQGAVQIDATGGFVYSAATGSFGRETFTYLVSDGQAVSRSVTVVIDVVAAVATAPVETPAASDYVDESIETESESSNETVEEKSNAGSESALGEAAAEVVKSVPHSGNQGDGDEEAGGFLIQLQNDGDDRDAAAAFLALSASNEGDQFQFGDVAGISVVDADRVQASGMADDFARRQTDGLQLEFGLSQSASVMLRHVTYQDFSELKGTGEQIDAFKENLESEVGFSAITTNGVALAGTSIVVGSVVTALRTGMLALGFLSQLPVWTFFDPLMVVDGVSGDEGDSLEDIVDRRTEEANRAEEPTR